MDPSGLKGKAGIVRGGESQRPCRQQACAKRKLEDSLSRNEMIREESWDIREEGRTWVQKCREVNGPSSPLEFPRFCLTHEAGVSALSAVGLAGHSGRI